MTKNIKNRIRSILEWMIGVLGYDVLLGKKGITRFAQLDKLLWQPFLESDRLKLYQKAMLKTDMISTDNFPRQLRFDSLQQTIEHVLDKKIAGDFAECGCWKGLSAYITCTYLQDDHQNRHFHIFDSFEGGLSEKSSEDQNLRFSMTDAEIRQEKLQFSSTEEQLLKALDSFSNFSAYRGWIPERFSEVKDQKFAFVNIDVDLFLPTKDSLEFFYPRMSKGGIIVCDDYNMSQFPGAKKAVDDFVNSGNSISYFYEIPMGGCILIV